MNVQDRIEAKRVAVDCELKKLLREDDSPLFEAMRYAVLSGGKRFRPVLLLCSGECFGVSLEMLLPFSCGLELIHNYSLIHDDLPSMDNDDYRRGKPSCHKAFGEGLALLAGDGLISLAFEVLAGAPVPPALYPEKQEVIREISRAAGSRGMVAGQLLDITLPPQELTEEKIHELILKKTGSLIVSAVKSGAILGKAAPGEIQAIEEYGKKVGLAFQVRDDLIDAAQQTASASPPRPNYALVVGRGEAQRRLEGFVADAIQALEKASLRSGELRELALKLLRVDKGD